MSENAQETTPTRDDLLKQSYVAATKRLREDNLEQFNKYRVEEAKARGIEWTPPKTAEQKAKEEYDRLIADFPHLAQQPQAGTSEV